MPRVLAALVASLSLGTAWADPLTPLHDRADILGWEAVGRLDLDGRGYCTASLIAPDLVLTAAHCLFGEDGARLEPGTLTFSAGLRDGEAIATRQAARAVVPTAYRPEDPGTVEAIRNDVALLELAEPIPASTADPFPLAGTHGERRRVTVLSYGLGRSRAMSREMGCVTLATGSGLMAFDCQASPGSSGAPIFDMSGRSPRIVSIVSGTGEHAGRPAVFGMEVVSVVASLKTALRTGEGVWPGPAAPRQRVIGLSERGAGTARFIRP